jgi:hypothetical protein
MIGDVLRLLGLVVMGGGAVAICHSQVHPAGVFAGTAAISGNASRPAFAITGRGAVHVLQRLVMEVGV